MPTSTLLAGIKAGELHQGHFNANQYNYLEVRTGVYFFCSLLKCPTSQGQVSTPAFSKPVLLQGRENMNRAVHGDIVVVEVFPEAEWSAPADEVVDQDSKLDIISTRMYTELVLLSDSER